MTEMYEKIKENIQRGRPSSIVCAVSSKGSSPVKSGAYMLADKNGSMYGTVGGGAVENTAIKTASELISHFGGEKNVTAMLKKYDLGGDLSMVCGGEAELLYCIIPPYEKYKDVFDDALSKEKSYEKYSLMLPLDKGGISIRTDIASAQKNGIAEIDGSKYYYGTFCNEGRVFIFGSGHVASECAFILKRLGFRYIVIDDRRELITGDAFQTADEVIEADYSRLDNIPHISEKDYILIMTRGHKYDMEAEIFALGTPARYIGMLGSRKKAEFSREYLRKSGYAEDSINRIICPAGIDIASRTPAEIAVSITAQLIEKRYGS